MMLRRLAQFARQIGRALSRLLNAVTGGEGDTTFSARSYALKQKGAVLGRLRVVFVDWLNNEPGHCEKAYQWHKERGLLEPD